jgi:hypothetical protein
MMKHQESDPSYPARVTSGVRSVGRGGLNALTLAALAACCDGGSTPDATACSADGCAALEAIVPCPATILVDPFAIDGALLVGSTLTLELTHRGDCQRHDYTLCYSDLAESSREVVEAHVIHDARGDTCDTPVTETQSFDLRPLAEAYMKAFETNGGVVDIGYGVYGFGALGCDDRATVAALQTAAAAQHVDAQCSGPAGCIRTSMDTRCQRACGTVTSVRGGEELRALLANIDEVVCGATGECPAPAAPPCAAPLGIDCVSGRCVEVGP